MSLNPQCYANKPAGITDANTKLYTGLNNCLSSCKNGLRATYWVRNGVGHFRSSTGKCMADLSGRRSRTQLSVFVRNTHELWFWDDVWSRCFLCKFSLISIIQRLISRDIIIRPKLPHLDLRNVNKEKQQRAKQLLDSHSAQTAGQLVRYQEAMKRLTRYVHFSHDLDIAEEASVSMYSKSSSLVEDACRDNFMLGMPPLGKSESSHRPPVPCTDSSAVRRCRMP
jgi:hypothetical protein